MTAIIESPIDGHPGFYRRNGLIYFRLRTASGRVRRVSTGTEDIRKALRVAEERRAREIAIANGWIDPAEEERTHTDNYGLREVAEVRREAIKEARSGAARTSLRDLYALWLTHHGHRLASVDTIASRIDRAIYHFGDRDVHTWRQRELSEWVTHLRRIRPRGKALSDATINRHVAALRRVYRWAIRTGHIEPDRPLHFEGLTSREEARIGHWSWDHFGKLREAAHSAELQAAIVIGYWTGLRLGEIAALDWSWIDFEERVIIVPAEITKTRNGRMIPLAPTLAEYLRAGVRVAGNRPDRGADNVSELAYAEEGPLFSVTAETLSQGFARLRDRESKRTRSTAYRRALQAGTFHDLRHTMATNLVRAGWAPFDVAAILGHSDLRTTQRYVTPGIRFKADPAIEEWIKLRPSA